MRSALLTLFSLCPLLSVGCGSTAERTGTGPSGEAEAAQAPKVELVSGHVPAAPLVPARLVYAISKATLPPEVAGAERASLDAIVAQLRAGRTLEAHRAWQALVPRLGGADPKAVAYWLMREGCLFSMESVTNATAALQRHEQRRAKLRDEAAQARDVANTLSQGYTIRYERLDPETMTLRAPRRVTGEELTVYAGELETADKGLREETPALRRDVEKSMKDHPDAVQDMSNALKLFLG